VLNVILNLDCGVQSVMICQTALVKDLPSGVMSKQKPKPLFVKPQ